MAPASERCRGWRSDSRSASSIGSVGEREEGYGGLVAGTVLAACGALLGGVENVSYDFVSKALSRDGGKSDPDAFAVGAAWGALIGVAGAALLTLITVNLPEESHLRPRLGLALGTATASDGRRLVMPTLAGRF
jgi:hypothetical protein